jgi:hypothetical protein
VDNCPAPGSPPPCKKWDCSSCSWVDKCPPDTTCPPECLPGAPITDTKVLINGAEMTGAWDEFCVGQTYEITATAGNDAYDVKKYYRLDCSTCGCVYDHEENIPGSVSRTGPKVDDSGTCIYHVIYYRYKWESDCDSSVDGYAAVRIRNCPQELGCCYQDCRDAPDVAICGLGCIANNQLCQSKCPSTP